jgi:hypothetical protein
MQVKRVKRSVVRLIAALEKELVVKIKRKSPEYPRQFQGVLRVVEGSKRLIRSTSRDRRGDLRFRPRLGGLEKRRTRRLRSGRGVDYRALLHRRIAGARRCPRGVPSDYFSRQQ